MLLDARVLTFCGARPPLVLPHATDRERAARLYTSRRRVGAEHVATSGLYLSNA